MKLACITGATGCLGRNIVEQLIEKDWQIVVLHRKSSDLSRLAGLKLKFQEVNLYDIESVRAAIPTGVNAVFHPAGNTSHWASDRGAQWKDNVLATRNLVQVSLEKKVERFIFTSTGATRFYQETNEALAMEINPNYVRTKRLSELEVYSGFKQGLDVVVLHPIIVVGAYDYNSYGSIFEYLKTSRMKFALPGLISFCHARDVAAAHVQAYESGRSGERYVLGGPYLSWQNFFQKIADLVAPGSKVKVPSRIALWLMATVGNIGNRLFGLKPNVTPELIQLTKSEPEITIYDKIKAEKDLKYKTTSVDQMIEDCYQWLKKENKI